MRLMSNYFHYLLSLDAHIDNRTDSQALRAEYCIVFIQHNTAVNHSLLCVTALSQTPVDGFKKPLNTVKGHGMGSAKSKGKGDRKGGICKQRKKEKS